LIPIPIEDPCQKGARKPPHNAEWSEHQAAPAHEPSSSRQAENSLHDISDESPQDKKAGKLEETAAPGETFFLCLYAYSFRPFYGRKGFDHTLLDTGSERICQQFRCLVELLRDLSNPALLLL